ncbi:cysteinyl-tRNA-synthetase [Ordospora colligata]|uniref:cysteine--tRNA ligase n=1 Tax=Ordospora colligata OC4 TaxID=1354746 RepID=A0A0B2UDH8_9MICR|nr:cysteinyl-tRNA-synthetase [Ordospora colligata OC4]KHN69121.1 cysteinyl-tRNA-synthetase [Ordospora colligata OC4]TBU14576.1 cysteinyl-tRNA-synthetase [Ordospora colligata]TBU14770.1 cysteinyl-tRNA-synthetase [Ordospora colligata]TBU18204.1 cysteinyl-tRNA-synthetase [Ordospora colligata]
MKGRLRLYNSITKTMEDFVAGKDGEVKMYICGPTVYDSPHIGHARTYVMFDVIRRVLRDYMRYNVEFVMNITDIDDKIIIRANSLGVPIGEVTKKYTDEFFDDMKALNVEYPLVVTYVTAYVEKIVKFIEDIEKNGYAYESNQSVYFDLVKYKEKYEYPVMRNSEGINFDGDENSDKRNACDFVLWKKSKENEPSYKSKWGDGRPGWHIECSVMSSDVFGDSLDIHAGGIDLGFPHHENEIAQCQGYFMKKPWTKYFLHTGHLNINGMKMSKSLKNFTTIKEMLVRTSARQLRIMFLHHHWNKDMNYEEEQLKFAESVDKKISNFMSVTESIAKNLLQATELNEAGKEIIAELRSTQKAVHTAILDNIDMPAAMKRIMEMINFTNTRMWNAPAGVILSVRKYVSGILDVFGLYDKQVETSGNEDLIAQMICEFRGDVRRMARQKEPHSKFLERCDRVRDDIKGHGYLIEDKNSESIIRRK